MFGSLTTNSMPFGNISTANNNLQGNQANNSLKPANTFGNVGINPTLQSTQPPTTNLFGQPVTQQPTATGFSVNQGASNNIQQPVSLFGKPTTTPGGLFGNSTVSTNAFGNSSFGAPTSAIAPSNSILGASVNTQPTSNLFGNSITNFGGNTNSFQTSQNSQPVYHASVNRNPYGLNPLLQKSPDNTNIKDPHFF